MQIEIIFIVRSKDISYTAIFLNLTHSIS